MIFFVEIVKGGKILDTDHDDCGSDRHVVMDC